MTVDGNFTVSWTSEQFALHMVRKVFAACRYYEYRNNLISDWYWSIVRADICKQHDAWCQKTITIISKYCYSCLFVYTRRSHRIQSSVYNCLYLVYSNADISLNRTTHITNGVSESFVVVVVVVATVAIK